jgi:hypothetical protein
MLIPMDLVKAIHNANLDNHTAARLIRMSGASSSDLAAARLTTD